MVDQDTPTAEPATASPLDEDDGFEWAIVEIFGHRRHAGRAREEERFGSKMLRIDVPVDGDPAKGWTSHFYGGASIFSYTLTDEATALQINRPYRSASRYTLPAPNDDPYAGDALAQLEEDLGGSEQ